MRASGRERAARHVESVFLNVPFDARYEPQFLALVSAVVLLGRRPRCVLEIEEDGRSRLTRLFETMAKCTASIHDMSRVGTPVRFNMPFELGLACALSEQRAHKYFVFDAKRYRLQRTLSDLNGRDAVIHGGKVRGTISAVFEVLRAEGVQTSPDDAFQLYQDVQTLVRALKRKQRQTSVFSRLMFQETLAGAIKLADRRNLLPQ
jgi:hypothetical protein